MFEQLQKIPLARHKHEEDQIENEEDGKDEHNRWKETRQRHTN